MLRTFLYWVFTLFVCYSATSQTNGLTWHALGIEDGLSQATNYFVYKDTRGFVWIGSIAGLNRYDGTSIKVYMPDENDPASMLGENIQSDFFEDYNGDIWFATHDAINKYNWNQDCFDHYQLKINDFDPKAKFLEGYYIFYIDPQQYLWLLAEDNYVFTFHIPTGKIDCKGQVKQNSVRCLPITDPSGNITRILIRGRDWAGISVVDINTAGEMSPPRKLSSSEDILTNNIKPVLAEGDTTVWFLSSIALIRYSFLNGHTESYPLSECESMVKLNDSIFLIGSLNGGLKTFNKRKATFINEHQNTGPRSASGGFQKINYITRDKDGTIWLSTLGVGLHYAHPQKNKFGFIQFSDYIPFNTEINPIKLYEHEPGKLLCFTTTDGVLEIDLRQGVTIKPYKPLEGLKSHKTKTVTLDTKGRCWIGTWSGIYIYQPLSNELIKVTDSIGLTSHAGLDGQVFYTSSLMGLWEGNFDQNGKPFYKIVDRIPVDQKYIPVLLDHKNRIWLNKNVKEFKIFDPITYDQIANIPITGICEAMAITEDQKSIFIASSTGLYEIEESTLKLRKAYTPQTGLPALGINSILKDTHQHLWLGHSKGIAVFDPQTGKAKGYGWEDGLPNTEFTPASCIMKNGLFCFASNGGITTFYPDSVREIRTSAIPQITGLQINDKDPEMAITCRETGNTHFPEVESLVFSYRHNTLSFRIHSLEYSAPETNSLRYSMEELDKGFITEKNGNRIRYPSMPPGEYEFVLYASNSDGIENPVPRILHIEIKTPFYLTWWFRTLVALLIFSIVAYIIYLRFSKKLELQNIRLKLYENLHDDVGSRLTAIVLSAEDLEQNENISHPKIKAISKIARSIVGNMRRLVWAIDPVNDKMMSIIQKINHDKSLILDDRIDFSIEVDESLKNLVLPGEIRYQMSSVCNEAFTNISKYAQASKVSVKVKKEHKAIKLLVTDDGKGFDPEEKSKNTLEGSGYGMANMKRRASRAGGEFNVYSKPGEGTRIEFIFPFKV
jgi:ligand-binding sensor domain-containing protein/two-component sensor histidine kinase